jgi:mono/diheme cytochrome c family protein
VSLRHCRLTRTMTAVLTTRTTRSVIAPAVCAVLLAACGNHDDLASRGRRVFRSAGCGSCHTLAAAHTGGRVGPDFDTSERLGRRQIRDQLNVGEGGMPSFEHRLTAHEEDAVTTFLYEATHDRH